MRYKNWLMRSMLAAAFIHTAGMAGAAHADDYDTMRIKWAARGGAADTSDADVAARITSINSAAQSSWSNMIRGDDRSALWSDLADFSHSATVTSSWTRLRDLTRAYYSSSSPLKGNPDLLYDIQGGITWLINAHYSSETVEFDNWYDWQIGSPLAFVEIMQLMYDDMQDYQIEQLMTVIQRFVPDPTRRLSPDGSGTTAIETGANLLDKCYIVAMHGMLRKLGDKLTLARDSMSPALAYVTTGDGFYTDGTFVQHTSNPYVGGYGGPLLTDIGRLYFLLGGSPWDITDPNRANAYDWVMNSYRPFIYDGAMMDNQRGRQITRETAPDHLSGRGFVANMLAVTDSLPATQADQIKSVMKGWMQRDTSFTGSYFGTLPVNGANLSGGLAPTDITRLKAILNDPSIPAADEAVESRYYASAGRALQRRPGHAFALSTFSKRTTAFESGNGENLNGWWTGIGRTYLYNADQGQYSGNYWATSDMWRQPGTTTDHSGSGAPVAWKTYGNPRTGVGGAQLDQQYVAAGMEFSMLNSTGSALSGKKAWFLLGDKVVAMGAALVSTDGRPVETIVENRKLNDDGGNTLTVNSVEKTASLGWQESMAGVSWAHLAAAWRARTSAMYSPMRRP